MYAFELESRLVLFPEQLFRIQLGFELTLFEIYDKRSRLDEQRVRLIRLANERGVKGFSALVQEALEMYLDAEARRKKTVVRASKLRGVLRGKKAEQLERSVKEIRERWR